MEYKVTFHRTYEIDYSEIYDTLIGEGLKESELTKEVLESEALNIAKRYFDEDIETILTSDEDDFSSTIEKIE